MAADQNNPCMTCVVDKKCCRVMGLKLSKREFEAHFKKYSDRLSIIKYKNMYIISPRDDRPCPHLIETGCGIYLDRPIDCRLYPYDLHQIKEKNGTIEIVFYDQTDCPHKEGLFIPVEEAKELMRYLARELYGKDKPIKIKFSPGETPPRVFGVFDPIISWISRKLRTYK